MDPWDHEQKTCYLEQSLNLEIMNEEMQKREWKNTKCAPYGGGGYKYRSIF